MSARAVSHVWQFSRAKGSERLILLAIADEGKDDGHSRCDLGTLEFKSQLSHSQTVRVITTCVEKGYLRKVRGGGAGNKNEYVLLGIGLDDEGSQDAIETMPEPSSIVPGKQSRKQSQIRSQDAPLTYKEEESKAGKASSPTEKRATPNFVSPYVDACRATGYTPVERLRKQAGDLGKRAFAEGQDAERIHAALAECAKRRTFSAFANILADLQATNGIGRGSLSRASPAARGDFSGSDYSDLPRRHQL